MLRSSLETYLKRSVRLLPEAQSLLRRFLLDVTVTAGMRMRTLRGGTR